MKKLFYLVLILASFVFVGKAFAADASLSMSGGGSHDINSDFSVTVSLGDGSSKKICAVNFDISYPSDLLELKSAPTLGSVYTLATVADSGTAGKISYQIGAIGCPTSGGTILTIPFHAKAAGQGTLSFSNIQALGGDDGQADISLSQSGSSITINSQSASTTTTNNSTTGTTATGSTASGTTPSTTTTKNTKKSTSSTDKTTTPAVTLKDPVISNVVYDASAELNAEKKQSKGILFSGTADADAKINITIKSDPINATAQSDASGKWSYLISDWFTEGLHQITVSSEKSSTKSKEVSSSFIFATTSKDQIALGDKLPEVKKVVQEVSTVVSEPSTNTKTGSRVKVLILGGGGAVLVLISAIVLFILHRRNQFSYDLKNLDLNKNDHYSSNRLDVGKLEKVGNLSGEADSTTLVNSSEQMQDEQPAVSTNSEVEQQAEVASPNETSQTEPTRTDSQISPEGSGQGIVIGYHNENQYSQNPAIETPEAPQNLDTKTPVDMQDDLNTPVEQSPTDDSQPNLSSQNNQVKQG